MEAVCSSDTLEPTYKSTRRHNQNTNIDSFNAVRISTPSGSETDGRTMLTVTRHFLVNLHSVVQTGRNLAETQQFAFSPPTHTRSVT
jgi:hypothetical protein